MFWTELVDCNEICALYPEHNAHMMDFFFFRFNRWCSFRVSRKPVILGYTGPLITKFEFVKIKTHDLGVSMAYINSRAGVWLISSSVCYLLLHSPRSHHGDPTCLFHAILLKQNLTHVFSVHARLCYVKLKLKVKVDLPLCLINHHIMTVLAGVEVWLHTFPTTLLGRNDWSGWRPRRFSGTKITCCKRRVDYLVHWLNGWLVWWANVLLFVNGAVSSPGWDFVHSCALMSSVGGKTARYRVNESIWRWMWLTRSEKEPVYTSQKGRGHWTTDLKLSRGPITYCLPIGTVCQVARLSIVVACAATCWELLLVRRCYCAVAQLKTSHSAATLHLVSITAWCSSRCTSHDKNTVHGCRERDRRNIVSGVCNG